MFVRFVNAIKAELAQWQENRRLQNDYRQQLRESNRQTTFQSLCEYCFMVLDYDPTDSESGIAENPTLRKAIGQWASREIWSRRIEIIGFVLLISLGLFCYRSISTIKNAQTATFEETIDAGSQFKDNNSRPLENMGPASTLVRGGK